LLDLGQYALDPSAAFLPVRGDERIRTMADIAVIVNAGYAST
jgi:hypothetical protein